MTRVAELLGEVERCNCRLVLDGEKLRWQGPAPLPDPIIAELRARKAEVIRFLAQQGERAVPAEWVDGVERLRAMPAVADWPLQALERLQEALPGFMAGWAPQAAALGWGTLDLFGCHPQAPHARRDQQGLVLGLPDFEVVAMSERSAAVLSSRDRQGRRMTYNRRPTEMLNGAVPAWRLAAHGVP